MTPRKWLVAALHRLAMPAEAQVRYLTAKGVAPSADELALEFDDAFRGAQISAPERGILCPLDAYLSKMSGPKQAAMWTIDALRIRPEWAEVRTMAQQALRHMGEGG